MAQGATDILHSEGEDDGDRGDMREDRERCTTTDNGRKGQISEPEPAFGGQAKEESRQIFPFFARHTPLFGCTGLGERVDPRLRESRLAAKATSRNLGTTLLSSSGYIARSALSAVISVIITKYSVIIDRRATMRADGRGEVTRVRASGPE